MSEYCKCYTNNENGKIIGCHLTLDEENGCGGYITDEMLKEIKELKKP